MTPEQQQLAYGLIVTPDGLRRVSPQDFAHRFPSALDEGKLALSLLEDSARSRNDADLVATLVIGATFGFNSAHVPILCQILQANWHRRHEEVVATLQHLKDARATDALYEASLASHRYLAHDEFHGLARRCTWALADIGTPAALGKLQLLAASEDPWLTKFAQKRIDNWQREQYRKSV